MKLSFGKFGVGATEVYEPKPHDSPFCEGWSKVGVSLVKHRSKVGVELIE